MHKKTLNPLASKLGLGLLFVGLSPLLAACPTNDPATTDGSSSGTGTTEEDPTNDPTNNPTNNPTNDPTNTTKTTDTPTMDTTTDEPTGPSTDPTTTTDPTGDTDTTTGAVDNLCSRLGGAGDGGIKDLVTDFVVNNVLLDEKINGYFLNSDVDGGGLIGLVTDQLGVVAECPGVEYGGMNMKDAHAGLKISDQDFNDFAADFVTALDAHIAVHPEVTDDDKTAIIGVLIGFKGDIVEDLTDDGTVYQRVGRKPAIKSLIGDPDSVDSFVGVVAADAAINSFFAASDFLRLNTCLTRQVAGIDGPTKYGQEVDSPAAGIDDGVSAASPCLDMVSSHESLMDADMTTITIEDFGALVSDLVTAMSTAGIAADDQNAILGALGPLCDQIVVGAAEKNKCMGSYEDEVVEASDLALALKDDAYDGTLDSMVCTDLVVTDNADLLFTSNVQLTIGMDHTYVGEVTIKVASPNGTILTVLQRPGAGALTDDGKGCCGDSSNLAKGSPITFKNGGLNDARKLGVSLPLTTDVVCQDDLKCEYDTQHNNGPGVDFNDFLGEAPAGAWKVCVGDSGTGDLGTLSYIGLTVTKVKFDPKL